jgi:hypothetical protein
MLLKQEFFGTCNNLGLEDGELTLAEIVWERCEKAMQGKPMQQAALVNSNRKNFKDSKTDDATALTQAELQTLTDGLALVLYSDERQLKEIKFLIEKLWNKSNPDDPASKISFDTMNTIRNMQRKVKKDHAKLARIQHKLKKMKGK